MAQSERERRASLAVLAELTRRGWRNRDLSASTGKLEGVDKPVDVGTIGDFLNGSRWPRRETLSKFERVFNWPAGSIEAFALEGGTPMWEKADQVDVPVGSGVDPSVLADLDPSEAARVLEYIALIKAGRRDH